MFSSGSPWSVNRNGLDIVQIVRSVPYIEYKEREKLSIRDYFSASTGETKSYISSGRSDEVVF